MVVNRFINAYILICSFLIIVIPFVVFDDLVRPTQTGKFIFFCISIVIFIALFAVEIVLFGLEIYLTVIDLSVLIFFLFVYCNKIILYQENYLSIRFLELCLLIVWYGIIRKCSKYNGIILLAIGVSVILQAIYGQLQILGWFESYHNMFAITGGFFNPGPYAGYLVSGFSIFVGLVLYSKKFKLNEKSLYSKTSPNRVIFRSMGYFDSRKLKGSLNIFGLVGICLVLLVVLATKSRAAWLSIVLSSFLFLLVEYRNLVSRRYLLYYLLFFFLIGIFLFFYKLDSSNGRLLIWEISWLIFRDYPICGVGFDMFQANFMNYQALYFTNSTWFPDFILSDIIYAFNDPLQFSIENGILGILVVVILVMISVWSIIKGSGYCKIMDRKFYIITVCFMIIVSILVFSFFSYPSQILPIKIILFSTIAILSMYSRKFFSCKINFLVHRLSLFVFFVIIVCFVYPFMISVRDSYQNWNSADRFLRLGFFKEANHCYRLCLPVLSTNGEFLTKYGIALTRSGQYKEAVIVLSRARKFIASSSLQLALSESYRCLGQYDKCERELLLLDHMLPDRFYSKYLLVKLYLESGDIDKARLLAIHIHHLPIKVDSDAIDEIKNEIRWLLD